MTGLHCSDIHIRHLHHRSGTFWRQEKQSIFRDKEETQLLYQHGGYLCAVVRAEGEGLCLLLSLHAVHCQCAGSMETGLLCWCRSFPSPLLLGPRQRNLPLDGLPWMTCARNRWQSCSLHHMWVKENTNLTFFIKTNMSKYCCHLCSSYQEACASAH